MAFLYDYMTESELELAKEDKEFEMESTRIMNAMAAIEMKHELDIKQIESRAMFENYTDDQLTEAYEREYLLYTEATDNAWARFKAWIREFVKKIFGGKKVDVPSDMSNREVTLDDNPGKIRAIIDRVAKIFKTDNGDLNLMNIAITGFGSVVGIKLLKDKLDERKAEKTKIKAGQLSSEIAETEKSVKNLSDSIPDDPKDNKDNSIKSTLIAIGNFVVDLGRKIINNMKDMITKITGHKFKSQEEENTDANGETNDNGNASDSSNEGEKPVDNASGNNADQRGNSANNKKDNAPKKIHAGESQSSVSGGKYKIDWDKVTKVADVKVPLDDILDYGKKEEVLKQLSKMYFVNVSSSHGGRTTQSLKATDITPDILGTKGLSEIISLAKSNGAEGIQEWGKVVTALNKLGLYKNTQLRNLADFKEKQSADKSITKDARNKPDISEEGFVRAVLSKSIGKTDAYKNYPSVKSALNTLTPDSAKVPSDTKTFDKLVNTVKSSLSDEEKKRIVEDFMKYYKDVYDNNREQVDAVVQSMGVDLLSTSGTTVDSHNDSIEKAMVKFANKNHVVLFGNQAPDGMKADNFRLKAPKNNKIAGWKGDYCFDPTKLPAKTRFALMTTAASNIFGEKIDKSVVTSNLAEVKKFAQYLQKLTDYKSDGAGRDRLPKDSYLKDLGIKLESTYESIDFDEFENILVTESEIDMMFESTTSEIVAEINEILESTFMSAK